MTFFNTQTGKDIGFFLQFETDDKEKFLFMQEQARKCVDNKHKEEHPRYGHWILEARHFFNDYGDCEVYVIASCSECKKIWHGDRAIFSRTLYDYNIDDMPDPITEERIKRCKERCLQEGEKYILTESPFCEKCGTKMS